MAERGIELIDVCCSCCYMECSCDCCCAVWCCLPCTYVSAVKQLGVSEFNANLAGCCLCLSSDPNVSMAVSGALGAAAVAPASAAAPSVNCALKLISVFLGQNNRNKFDYGGFDPADQKCGDNVCCRFFCEPCVVCQEIDAAIKVARKVRADEAITFGDCGKGKCCYLVNQFGKVLPPREPKPVATGALPPAALPIIGYMPRS